MGHEWTHATIQKMLKNYNYTGNLLLQKTYRENYITKRKVENNGERAKFYAANTHEPIISCETFELVQTEQKKRAEKYKPTAKPGIYPFSSKLVCSGCGKHYKRRKTSNGFAWICSTFNTSGKAACPTSKQIPELCLESAAAQILGLNTFDAEKFSETVEYVKVGQNNQLDFYMKNGGIKKITWKERSRSESWTPEMKELARQKKLAAKEAT